MKTLIVKQSQLSGEIVVPSSKSQTHRAILLGSLAKGRSIVQNPLNSSDSQAMIQACRHLGAKIDAHDDYLEIQGVAGRIVGAEDVIHAHNSGIILRFMAAIAALGSEPIIITGDHSIRNQRPMQTMLDSLTQLGAKATSARGNGFAPIIIQGPLKPGRCKIANGADSQNVSSLLLAAAFLDGKLELEVNQPGEKPWINLTLDWLKRLQVPFENHHYEKYIVQGVGSYSGFEYTVPGDWSSAAFPIAAALITQSELTLKNLTTYDLQGDKKILDIFKKMGAEIIIDDREKSLRVCRGQQLQGVTVDINDCIDAVTILAVVACYAEGETHLINAAVARQKECDRLACIAAELKKMGANIQETWDGLIIKGGAVLKAASVFSRGDHRMAMALAVAGMGTEGETHIQNMDCIAKTYPNFIKDFHHVGANINEQ